MNKCVACKKFLSPAGAASCNKCRRYYHKECVGIAGVVPDDWACPECKAKQRKTDNRSTPVKGLGEGMAPAAPVSAGPAPRSNDDAEITALRRDLNMYMAEQRQFREEIRASMTMLTARIDSIEQRLDAVERKAAETVAAPQGSEVLVLQQTVEQLQLELNDRDQDALLSDLDLGHVPEAKGENVVHTVVVLAAKLGVTLEQRNVVFAERVGAFDRGGAGAEVDGAASRPRRIVLRLARRQLRDELLRAARVRRSFTSADADLPGTPRRIYVNERLTRTNRLLFHRLREECRKAQWKYSWTRRGRVHARQTDGKQVFYFRSEADISRVFGAGSV